MSFGSHEVIFLKEKLVERSISSFSFSDPKKNNKNAIYNKFIIVEENFL